jgi:hypothetical protein
MNQGLIEREDGGWRVCTSTTIELEDAKCHKT